MSGPWCPESAEDFSPSVAGLGLGYFPEGVVASVSHASRPHSIAAP